MTPDVAGYRLERRLGCGGGAEVWLAWPGTGGGGPVAIKRAPSSGVVAPDQRPGVADRLRAEGRLLAGIDHPNLVAVLDVVDEPPDVALVLPYLAGGSLRDLLDDRGTLSAGELVAVVEPLAGALRALLDQGSVHGDLKPENVLFTADGKPVLVDVDAARPVGAVTAATEDLVGTPDYLDPSRLDGGAATPASDVFSLGVVAYEVLTGRRPHRGEPAEVLAAASVAAHRPLASWPTVDGAVAEVVERAMSPDPATRPVDPPTLAHELRRVVAASSIRLPGPVRTAPAPRRPQRLHTVRVSRPGDGAPAAGAGDGRHGRVMAARVAVAAASVALALWAGADRADPGPGREAQTDVDVDADRDPGSTAPTAAADGRPPGPR